MAFIRDFITSSKKRLFWGWIYPCTKKMEWFFYVRFLLKKNRFFENLESKSPLKWLSIFYLQIYGYTVELWSFTEEKYDLLRIGKKIFIRGAIHSLFKCTNDFNEYLISGDYVSDFDDFKSLW